jgi:uncharacterized membrane protein (DUF485 family)
MAHFDHSTTPASEPEASSTRRARIGQVLFALYFIFYGGFVLLNAFEPSAMEMTPWAGVNLAIFYGLALIGIAILLAVLYDGLCRQSAVGHRPSAVGQKQDEHADSRRPKADGRLEGEQ